MTTGAAVLTVNVAALVVAAVPTPLLNTASYSLPLCCGVAVPRSSVVAVAPAMGENEFAPAVSTIHCTVGVGVPVAAAVNVASVPASVVRSVGFVVTTGAAVLTVSVAALVVAAVPTPLLNTASYSLPLCCGVAVPRSSVVAVAPAMGENEFAPAVSTIHCTVGVGVPVAAAVNVASVPASVVTSVGFVVTTGAAVLTVKVAAVVVAAVPTPFLNTASYSLPLSWGVAAPRSSVVAVAPGIGEKAVAPAVCTIHCTVGVGVPVAAAVKVASPPASTVRSDGFDVTTGAMPVTVNVAADVVAADPTPLLKTASY